MGVGLSRTFFPDWGSSRNGSLCHCYQRDMQMILLEMGIRPSPTGRYICMHFLQCLGGGKQIEQDKTKIILVVPAWLRAILNLCLIHLAICVAMRLLSIPQPFLSKSQVDAPSQFGNSSPQGLARQRCTGIETLCH